MFSPFLVIMNYDSMIKKIFFTNCGKFSSKQYKKLIKGTYINMKEYIIRRFKDSNNIKESIYRIRYDIEYAPLCKQCNKKLNMTYKPNHLYRDFCSYECSNRYNDKIRKCKNTCLEKYGVKSTWQKKDSRSKAINSFRSSISQQKRLSTLKKNHTFNISKPENESYKLLKDKYPDVKYQYKSEKYPFACDFYIPSLDLYIECNYHWTHGGHPFNENCLEDQEKLKLWKSKNTKFYNNAINTWTIRDPNKRKIASMNDLNLLEIWNIDELEYIQ